FTSTSTKEDVLRLILPLIDENIAFSNKKLNCNFKKFSSIKHSKILNLILILRNNFKLSME
ncbi:MAG: hypothetical protein ACPLRO_07975, partial [Candidatus Kapaibacteriota bacterium]